MSGSTFGGMEDIPKRQVHGMEPLRKSRMCHLIGEKCHCPCDRQEVSLCTAKETARPGSAGGDTLQNTSSAEVSYTSSGGARK